MHIHGGPDMTLDDINSIGELVTESLDNDANVIWGARVSEDMKVKIVVMTIITGVNSPWILGRESTPVSNKNKSTLVSEELGIEIIR